MAELTNGLVQSYRQFLEQQGKVDDRPDIELTVDLGRILKDEGVFDSQAAQHPDFREQFYLATQNVDRSVLGEIPAALNRGVRGMGATAMGAAALGLDVLGADKTARSLARKAREFAAGGYDNQATVGSSDEIVDTKGAIRYGLGKIGEAAPSIAEALITAVIGAGVGTATAPGPGTVAGGIAGVVGKSAIKKLIQKGIAKKYLGRELGEEAVEAALTNAANTELRREFVNESRGIAARMGSGALGYINSLGLSSGEIYNETATDKDSSPWLALGAGSIAAIPDTVLPTYIIGKYFPGAAPATARSFVKRLGVEAAKVIPGEAGTEAFQELINIAAAKYAKGEPPTLKDEDWKRLREAMIGGAAGGVLGAPLAAAPSGRAPTPASVEEEDPALAARRAAATGVPLPPLPATPVSPPAPTPGQIMAKVIAMTPEDQDARLKVLVEAASLSPIEQQELVVLRAKVAQRPGSIAAPTPLAPSVVTPPAEPTAAAVPAPAPLDERYAEPVETAAPPVAEANAPVPLVALPREPAKPAPIPLSFHGIDPNFPPGKGEMWNIGEAIMDPTTPGRELHSAGSTILRTTLEGYGFTVPVAPVIPSDQKEVPTETAQAAVGGGLPAAVSSQAAAEPAAPAPGRVGPATAAPVAAPTLAPPAPLPFGRIVNILSPNDKVVRSQKGNKTNVGILLRDDTNPAIPEDARPVLFKGEFEYGAAQPLLGKSGEKAYGMAVQNMGVTRTVAKVTQKLLQADGNKPVLLTDLANKFTPIMRVAFDGEPQVIDQIFPNLAAFTAAVKLTEAAPAAPVEPTKIVGQEGAQREVEKGGVPAGAVPLEEAEAELAKEVVQPEVLAMREPEPVRPAPPRVSPFALTGINKVPEQGITGLYGAIKATKGKLTVADFDGPAQEAFGLLLRRSGLGVPEFGKKLMGAFAQARNAEHFADILKGRKPRLDPAEQIQYTIFKPQPHPLDPTKTIPGYVQIERTVDARGQPLPDAERAKYPKPPASLPNGQYSLEQIYGAIAMEQGTNQMAYQAAPQFAAMIDRLRRQGFDIELLMRELGEIAQNAYTHGPRIVLTMADLANANMTNLVSLIHEVGHVEVFRLSGGMQAKLSAAVDRTFGEVQNGQFITRALNANENWEEKLVEKFGIKLTEEGFGAESATLAQTIWRTVKELYHRIAIAMAHAFGVEVSDARVIAWFENNLRKRLGGDFDYRYIDLFASYIEKAADMVRRFTVIDGQDIPDLYDPITHTLRRALVLPDSPEAAEWNIKWRHSGDLGKELNIPREEADARIQAAAINHVLPTLNKLKEEAGKAQTKVFWESQQKIIDKLETMFPGSGTATIGGERMTSPMNELAQTMALHTLQNLTRTARKRAMRDGELIEEHGTKVARESDLFNKTGRDFMNGAVMDDAFNEELRELIKDLSAGISNGTDAAFAAGTLHGAIRELEKLRPEQAIPADYQNAFKHMLDKGGVSVIEQMKAIAKLNLDLANMKVPDVIAAIKANAEGDPALAALVTQRPLMVALASLARNSSRSMDLLQFRATAADAQYAQVKAELDEIRTANETRLDEIELGIKAVKESGALQDRLRRAFHKAKRNLQRAERALTDAAERKLQREHFATVTAKAAANLEPDVGAFSTWEAHDKAPYIAMRQETDGKWVRAERELTMVGENITAQEEQVAHDLQMNRLWLEQQRDDKGKPIESRLYNEVKRQVDQLSKLNFGRSRMAASRAFFEHYIQPIGDIFAGMGNINGTKVKQMLNQLATTVFIHRTEVSEGAKKWDSALQGLAQAANYPNPKRFMDEVVTDVIFHIENNPGMEEKAALAEAQKAARRRLKMNNFEPGPEFAARLEKFLKQHKHMTELMRKIGEDHGIYIEDALIKDPLAEKSFLMRHAVKHGWFTSSRRLNMNVIQILKHDMELAGWSDRVFSDPAPVEGAEVKEVAFHETVDNWPALIAKFFPANIVKDFVEPFVLKPGKRVFADLSQLQAQDLWARAEGDVLKFMDLAFEATKTDKTPADGLNEYRQKMLRTFRGLYTMESKIAAKAKPEPGIDDPASHKPHRMMDARTNELIPPEHYTYDMFTPLDAHGHLQEIAYHSAFGRDAKGLTHTLQNLEDALNQRAGLYARIPEGTTKSKKEFARRMAAEGRPGWEDFEALKSARKNLKLFEQYKAVLTEHFKHRASLGDVGAILEFTRMVMGLMLNQPKSALYNLPAMLEHPLVYRGLGKTSVTATTSAVKTFVHGLFKSMVNQGGADIIQAADHAIEVGDYYSVISQEVEQRALAALDYKTLLSDMGPAGEYSSGELAGKVKQFAHKVQGVQRKGFGKGGFNPVGIFNFIGAKADTGIGLSNARAFETIVSRAADYFAGHPEDARNPTFKLTAAHLGMKHGGWFSDEGAFDYFRNRAEEYRLGNLEQLGRDGLARRLKGEGLLTKQQVLTAANMALQEISLVAGINTRPVGILRGGLPGLASLLLGWPVAQMNKLNWAMRDLDGQLSMAAALRSLGVLAMWTLPAGLAYTLMMDEYDEEILNKKSNLRSLDLVNTLPVVGIPIGIAKGQGLAIAERLGRVGTYGLAGDFLNSVLNITDPTTGQRDFDLNSRILVFSMYATMRDTFRNFLHSGGEINYDTVIRPMAMTLGGGGALQAIQVINNALGLENVEAASTNRINVMGWLRAGGRDAGMELRAGGGRSSPTPLSVQLNLMKTAALANDRQRFLEAYRAAVEVARQDPEEQDPEQKVLQGFKSRHPLLSAFVGKPTEADMNRLMGSMNENGQRAIREAVTLYSQFEELIAPNPFVRRMELQQRQQMRAAQPLTIEQLRRRAMGY